MFYAGGESSLQPRDRSDRIYAAANYPKRSASATDCNNCTMALR